VGVASAAGSVPPGHSSGALVVHPSPAVSTTVPTPTTVPGPATAPAAVTTSVPATTTPPAPASAPPWASVTVSDSAATGPEGLQWIQYGDGAATPVTGMPAGSRYCTPAAPAASTSDYQHAFTAPGTYTVSISVQATCSGQKITLTLPVTVS